MIQRITNRSLYMRTMRDIQDNAASLFTTQKVVSSGLRFQLMSEDPTGGARALRLQSEEAKLSSFQDVAENTRASVDFTMQKLDDTQKLLAEAKALAIQGANGSTSDADRLTIASRVDALLSEVLSLANARFDERYVFGGTQEDISPFKLTESGDGRRVLYRGNSLERSVLVGAQDHVVINTSGDEAFSKIVRTTTEYQGRTGAAAGIGTDSATGEDHLIVRHVATWFGDESGPGGGDSVSGIRPGTSSSEDTILGPRGAHTLTLDQAAGTIQLDGGAAVSISGTETDLRLVNENGETVHLDLSALTPGFSGTIDLRGEGALSLDGGISEVAIDYSADQTVVDSQTGEVTHIDTRGIRAAGEEYLRYPGTADVFQTLIGLSDALRNTRELEPEQQIKAVSSWIDDLDRLQNHILTVEGEFGARSSHLENVQGRLDEQKLTVRTLLSSVRDADLSEAIVEFTRAQTALQAAQQVGVRVMQNSYSAFLR